MTGLLRRTARRALIVDTGGKATVWFTALAAAMLWPLPSTLGSAIARDLGDPLLNSWILAWNAEHVLDLLGGDPGALLRVWHGNIFHPEPWTLVYSELLVAQTLQILPAYAATGNILLAYNLLFLSSYVMCGLGAYLLVREITGDWRAGLLAGIAFAFAPFRTHQGSHLQVISMQWMPLTLYGFRRFFETRRVRPLAGGVAAFIAQNLSCGYYLFYFGLMVPAYVLYEMADRRLLRDRRTWLMMGGSAGAVLVGTVPFLWPYLHLRDAGLGERNAEEIAFFSADVYAYLTADPLLNLWGDIVRVFPRPEGLLFPGVLVPLLAFVAIGSQAVRAWRQSGSDQTHLIATGRGAVLFAILAIGVASLGGVILSLGFGGADWVIGAIAMRTHSATRLALTAIACVGGALAISPRLRRFVRGRPGSLVACLAAMTIAAFWLSLGPTIQTRGHALAGSGPYAWLNGIPGVDGLRVPARFAGVVTLGLSALAGIGGLRLARRSQAPGLVVGVLAGILLIESMALPLPINAPYRSRIFLDPPARVVPASRAPRVYRYLRELDEAVVAELPFGDPAWELRYVYYSTVHWKPIINGYSGHTPPSYRRRRSALMALPDGSGRGWRALTDAGVTHVVLHRAGFDTRQRQRIAGMLERRGAQRVATFGTDEVYLMP